MDNSEWITPKKQRKPLSTSSKSSPVFSAASKKSPFSVLEHQQTQPEVIDLTESPTPPPVRVKNGADIDVVYDEFRKRYPSRVDQQVLAVIGEIDAQFPLEPQSLTKEPPQRVTRWLQEHHELYTEEVLEVAIKKLFESQRESRASVGSVAFVRELIKHVEIGKSLEIALTKYPNYTADIAIGQTLLWILSQAPKDVNSILIWLKLCLPAFNDKVLQSAGFFQRASLEYIEEQIEKLNFFPDAVKKPIEVPWNYVQDLLQICCSSSSVLHSNKKGKDMLPVLQKVYTTLVDITTHHKAALSINAKFAFGRCMDLLKTTNDAYFQIVLIEFCCTLLQRCEGISDTWLKLYSKRPRESLLVLRALRDNGLERYDVSQMEQLFTSMKGCNSLSTIASKQIDVKTVSELNSVLNQLISKTSKSSGFGTLVTVAVVFVLLLPCILSLYCDLQAPDSTLALASNGQVCKGYHYTSSHPVYVHGSRTINAFVINTLAKINYIVHTDFVSAFQQLRNSTNHFMEYIIDHLHKARQNN